MKVMTIEWQRLVSSEGRTCDRCAATQSQVAEAVAILREALRPLDIEPRLEVREIDEASFAKDPTESNRIWISGRPLEAWLQADLGSSSCGSVCGDSQCRTVEVRGRRHEAIPQPMILKAALMAASEIVDDFDGNRMTESTPLCSRRSSRATACS